METLFYRDMTLQLAHSTAMVLSSVFLISCVSVWNVCYVYYVFGSVLCLSFSRHLWGFFNCCKIKQAYTYIVLYKLLWLLKVIVTRRYMCLLVDEKFAEKLWQHDHIWPYSDSSYIMWNHINHKSKHSAMTLNCIQLVYTVAFLGLLWTNTETFTACFYTVHFYILCRHIFLTHICKIKWLQNSQTIFKPYNK